MPPRIDRQAPLRPTVGSRLHFGWSLLCGAIITIPLALGLIAHYAIRPSAAAFDFWITRWARAIMAVIGIRLRTEVRSAVPQDQPVVLVANHQNMLDILTCAVGVPRAHGFAAKADLKSMPFIGAVLRSSPSVFVNRSSPRRAVESVREAAEVIRSGNSVLVYPEGSRSFGPEMGSFRRGAFLLAVEAGVPIVPVINLDNFQVMDEKRRASRSGTVHLVVAEAVPTVGLTRADIPRLMLEVRARMEAELERVGLLEG
jgi:1-acyl-sn-glycerol-3-phosphate acyltransferase